MRQKSSEARVLWLRFHRGYLLTSSNTRNGTKQGQAREINSVSGRKEAGGIPQMPKTVFQEE